MKFAVDIDADVAREMEHVAWNTVSELEAKSLGVSLGMYHDIQNETSRTLDFHKRTVKLTIVLLITCLIAIFFNFPVFTLTIGIAAVMLYNGISSQWYVNVTNSLTTAQKSALLHEVCELRKRHPITFQNQFMEEEHEFDIDDEGDE